MPHKTAGKKDYKSKPGHKKPVVKKPVKKK